MSPYSVSSTAYALLVFVDIVDSSLYSSILGIEKFADKILSFQELFRDLGNRYFRDKPYFDERVDSFCQVDSRGDEGLAFVVDPTQPGAELVLRAVKFALELKARLRFLNLQEKDLPPREMRIAVGIHYGEVAIITASEMKGGVYRKLINRIMGYSINYAKRVESSSRIGHYSQVFLSREAANLLSGSPIVLSRHEAPLKGIQTNDEVYEVRSAFLDSIPLSAVDGAKGADDEEFLTYVTQGLNETESLRDPWMKSFVLSVLESRKDAHRGTALEIQYSKEISKIAWRDPAEDDPIMLYQRARECEASGKYTRAVSCLRDLLRGYPHFIYARIRLVDACYRTIESKEKMSGDAVFVRDTAEELLEKYSGALTENEKKRLEDILEKAKAKADRRPSGREAARP